MKKSLVALAVLAASGASFAQSSVTVYGLADIWFGTISTDNGMGKDETNTVLESGGVNGSRWGLKGSEDLGGGLKANFKFEQGIALDTGVAQNTDSIISGVVQSGQAFSREAYVGLSGGFGEVKLGKVWTAYDDVSGVSNAVFDSKLAPAYWVMRSGGYISNPGNTIYYSTPTMSGFAGAISYSMGETAYKDAEILAVNVTYNNGPLALQFGYQEQDNGVLAGNDNAEFLRVGGSYDFGMATLKASYGAVSNLANVSGKDADEYQIGVDVPVGPAWVISAGYAASEGTGIFAEDIDGFGIAATYTLSKRTFLYGGYNSTSYDTPSADASQDIFAIGVQHKF